jgi:hypothetical protein
VAGTRINWRRFEKRHPARRTRTDSAVALTAVLAVVAIWGAIFHEIHGALAAASFVSMSVVWMASVLLHEIGCAFRPS